MEQEFKEAAMVIERLESEGHKAYFVGGCVRDMLLKRTVQDIDIATAATPNEVIGIFPSVIPVGIDHGTVIVRHKGVSYEVTTFRHEGTYSDNRHPDQVTFIRDIHRDLARRDFTMNALAMDKTGKIIDHYDGMFDLNHHLIRTVGSAEERFKEDALRIMRALRFSSQLGFTIEETTLKQMRKLGPLLQNIAVERLTVECTKFFQGEYIGKGLNYLKTTNIIAYLPIFKEDESLLDHLPKHVSPFIHFPEVIAFFHVMEPSIPIIHWINVWKCSNKQRNITLELVEAVRRYENTGLDNWLVYRLSKENWPAFIHLMALLFPLERKSIDDLEIVYQRLTIHSKKDIMLNGHEVSELFPNLKRGPWLGALVEQMEQKIVMGEIVNEKTQLKEWIRCHPPA